VEEKMLDISLIFKIAGVGILLVVLDKVLKESGKSEVATLTNIAGVMIILMMVINLIAKLFDAVKTMFLL
jgi:stage III sporulation protein AC